MRKRYAVLGLGRFGYRVATYLSEREAEVIAVDNDKKVIDEIKDKVTIAVKMDVTQEDALKAQGIHQVDAAIVCMGESFEANQLATLILKKLGVNKVITKANSPLQAQILKMIGADQVVLPELEMAERLAYNLLFPLVVEHLHLASGFSLVQMEAPKRFAGKEIQELDLRKRYHINIVAIKRRIIRMDKKDNEYYDEVIDNLPDPTSVIHEKDILILIGKDKSLEELTQG